MITFVEKRAIFVHQFATTFTLICFSVELSHIEHMIILHYLRHQLRILIQTWTIFMQAYILEHINEHLFSSSVIMYPGAYSESCLCPRGRARTHTRDGPFHATLYSHASQLS